MPRPLTPETLVYGLTLAGEPRVAPDGTAVAYTRTTADAISGQTDTQIWLHPLDGGAARRLTWSGARNTSPLWSPDGRALAFVSDRGGGSGLLVLPLDGGEAREITRHARPVSAPAWSPDGRTIAYNTLFDPENPSEEAASPEAPPRVRVTRRLDYKADVRGYLGEARQQVWVVDVASGERRRLTTVADDHLAPRWSPDGRWLAAKRSLGAGIFGQLALIPLDGGEPRLVGSPAGAIGLWSWSPGGDRIIIAGDTDYTGQLDLFLYHVAEDRLERLTDDLPCLPDAGAGVRTPPSPMVWLDDRRVLFHGLRAGASGLYVIDTRGGALETRQTWPALNAGLSVDDARRVAVQVHASLDAVGEVVAHDLAGGQSRLLTALNTATLAEAPPARWERLAVARGDLTIEAWLLFPPDFDPARRYPLVLDVHGGPHSHHGHGFSTVQQSLATHGTLVVYANPRGSATYGRAFARLVVGDWGGEDYRDLLAVVDVVVARPYVDPERVGIYGPSYGGYITAWAITQTDRFKAAVAVATVFDLVSMYGTSDIGFSFGAIEWGGGPASRRDWLVAHSPLTHAHRVTTPTLIVHGEADQRCPIGQAEQMFVALVEAGVEVEFARYPGGSHEGPRFGPPPHTADFLTRVLAWFGRWLGGPAEAAR